MIVPMTQLKKKIKIQILDLPLVCHYFCKDMYMCIPLSYRKNVSLNLQNVKLITLWNQFVKSLAERM